jgi:hypothetical protein
MSEEQKSSNSLKRLTIATLILTIIGWIISGIIQDVTSPPALTFLNTKWDDYTCQGRLSEIAADKLAIGEMLPYEIKKDMNNPHYLELRKKVFVLYEKAYKCGFPDSGLRLAAAYCKGVGVPVDFPKAKRIIMEIQKKYPKEVAIKSERTWKKCGFPD